MIQNKKGSILLVLKILEEYTDDNHYLTQPQIATKISQLYGIDLERKAIGSSLQLLEELDYDIVKGPKGGFALLSRTFDPSEASFLIDAIFSSKSINGKEAKRMAEEVSSCFSKYQRKDYSYIYKSNEINRSTNKTALYNVSIINEAISKGKRVGFQYLTYDKNGNEIYRNDGYEYIVSPYYLINNYGRYYLLCNYREKYRPLQLFRIDKMANIVIKDDWPIKQLKDLKDGPKDFSIAKYLNEHVYLFNEEVIDAKIILDGEWAIEIVKDWFGDNAKIHFKDEKIIATIKGDEKALYYWIMQYSDCVTVLSPLSLVEKIKKGLIDATRRYQDGN
ncbi:MAG: WYL domain-containing protein [Candidatus Enteromonas sp.]|nr:WYL domain-containing protein [Mollicutes bacterium]MDY3903728.1 WYL domain-containing protein [Candidatus Enteromonas sp.]